MPLFVVPSPRGQWYHNYLLCANGVFCPERATHLSPGQGDSAERHGAAALGFKVPKTISRPVRARELCFCPLPPVGLM